MAKAFVDIIGRDQTSAAFNSIDSRIGALGLQVGTLVKSFGLLAVAGGAAAFAGSIKSTIEFNDKLAKLSQSTGLAVETLAGLDFATSQAGTSLETTGKGLRSFSRLIDEAARGSKLAGEKISDLGLNFETLKNLKPEDQFFLLADAIKGLSKEDRAVKLTAALGDRMATLVPLLSGGADNLREFIAEGQKLNPVTAEAAAESERFNDNLDKIGRNFSSLSVSATTELLPALVSISDEMTELADKGVTLESSLGFLGARFSDLFSTDIVKGIFPALSALSGINDQLNGQLSDNLEKIGDAGKDAAKGVDELSNSLSTVITPESKPGVPSEFLVMMKERAKAAQASAKALKNEINGLKSEGESLTSAFDPLARHTKDLERFTELLNRGFISSDVFDKAKADSLKNYTDAIGDGGKAAKEFAENLKKIEEITKATRTEQEKYTDTVAELDRLLGEGLGAEAYQRALKDAREELERAEDTGVKSIDAIEQAWTQGARNIQSVLSNGIFNFWDDGLKGMLKNALSTIGRIASEFASIKLLQGAGLSGLFAPGTASASTGFSLTSALNTASSIYSGITGGISSTLGSGISSLGNSLGSSTLSSFGSGFAGTGAGAFSSVGGAGTAFIGGPGTAIGGSGLGGAAGAGATFASIAGPVAIVAAVDFALKQIFGDKKLGGAAGDILNFVPIVGTLINGLFGRSPEKFTKQIAQIDINSEGASGTILDEFRAKGSLFSKSKHRRSLAGNSDEIIDLFDSAVDGFISSTTELAGNLGISTDSISSLSERVVIITKDKTRITEEQIAEEISRIGNVIVEGLVPSIDELVREEEDYLTALQRLSNEFQSLIVVGNALGNSTESVKEFLQSIDIGVRSAFVESAGGIEALGQKTSFFAENFLSDVEKIAPVSELLSKTLTDLGLSADLTKKEFKDLVQSVGQTGGISEDLFHELFNIQGVFVEVRDATAAAAKETEAFAEAAKELEQAKLAQNLRIAKSGMDSFTRSIQKFKDLADSFRDSAQDIRGDVGASTARLQIEDVLTGGKGGKTKISEIPGLLGVTPSLKNLSPSGFTSRNDLQRTQSSDAALVDRIVLALEKKIERQQELKRDYSKDLFDLMRGMTDDGRSLNTA